MSKFAPNNTLQSKHGFQDDDLKTTEHDNIILWLEENKERVISNIIGYSKEEWSEAVTLSSKSKAYNYINTEIDNAKKALEVIKATIKEIEEDNRISESNKDFLTSRHRQREEEAIKLVHGLSAWTLNDAPKKNIKIKSTWEYPIKNGNFLIGFVDMIIDYSATLELDIYLPDSGSLPQWNINQKMGQIAFEIKSVMPSLGELVRQVRMYESFLPNVPFFIVSPDDRFASALQSQNIGFIKYEL